MFMPAQIRRIRKSRLSGWSHEIGFTLPMWTRMKVNSTNRHIDANSFQNAVDIAQQPSLCLGPIKSSIPKF
jgi:hypothetical protein